MKVKHHFNIYFFLIFICTNAYVYICECSTRMIWIRSMSLNPWRWRRCKWENRRFAWWLFLTSHDWWLAVVPANNNRMLRDLWHTHLLLTIAVFIYLLRFMRFASRFVHWHITHHIMVIIIWKMSVWNVGRVNAHGFGAIKKYWMKYDIELYAILFGCAMVGLSFFGRQPVVMNVVRAMFLSSRANVRDHSGTG